MTKKNDDEYEAFVRLYSKYEPEIRAFLRSLLPSWEDVNEVIQNVGIVLWRKFDTFDQSTHFMKWACIVSRYEVLSYRRDKARSRLAFTDKVFELMSEEAIHENEERNRQLSALENCLENLPENTRKMISLSYTPGVKTKDIASQMNISAGALYERLNQIRKNLMRCVLRRMEGDTA